MKMKMKIIALSLVFGLVACNNTSQSEENEVDETGSEQKVEETGSVSYSLDAEKSLVSWKGSMVGVYSHEGSLNVPKGSITMNNGLITEGEFTVDVNSMITTDSDDLYKMAPREKLIGHLKTDDFFGTETHPTSSFKIKSFNNGVITGDLTLKGVTKEETITDVVVSENDGIVSASGNLVFNRQNYGITYKNTMNDMILSDDIELKISISGKAESM